MSKALFRTLCVLLLSYVLLMACQGGEETVRKAQYITNGQKVYVNHCQNCHGAKGEGLGKLYPPLTDTTFLKENRDKLACIVAHGMDGEVRIHGEKYNTPMPANPQLSAVEIAYVLTYVTNILAGSPTARFEQSEIEAALKNCTKQAQH